MTRRILFGAMASVLMLASSCVAPMRHDHGDRDGGHRDGHRFQALDCNGDCPIAVTVHDDGKVCVVEDPGVQHVPRNAKAKLKWHLTGDFVFPENGVVVHDNAFNDVRKVPGEDRKMFILTDENKHAKYYKYEVNVNRKDGRPCVGVDPGVINDGCEGC